MARLHHPLDVLFFFLRRQDREAALDDLHRRVEDHVRWTYAEPLEELSVGRRVFLDTTRARQTQDRVVLLLGDRTLSPGNLYQRRHEERWGRVECHPKIPGPAQEI